MKLVALYHPRSDSASNVEDFSESCRKRSNVEVNLISLETIEGARLAEMYGIVEYPSLLVVREDGQLVKNWQGFRLPSEDEVCGYLMA